MSGYEDTKSHRKEELTHLGTLIRKYQNQLGITQKQLAKALSIDDSLLSKICTGDRTARREYIVELIKFFHKEGALHFVEEANDLLRAAGFSELSRDAPDEVKLLEVLQIRITSERKELILGLAALAFAAILVVFAIALVVVTPVVPDEFFVSIGALVSGVYGARELKKHATGKSDIAMTDKRE